MNDMNANIAVIKEIELMSSQGLLSNPCRVMEKLLQEQSYGAEYLTDGSMSTSEIVDLLISLCQHDKYV